jgi:hypothetical protein
MVSWDAYREIRIDSGAIGSDFDFLNSYQELAEPVAFYYTPGSSEPDPVNIRVDKNGYVRSRLRIGLASRSITNLSFPLGVKVTFHDGEGEPSDLAKGRDGRVAIGEGFVGEIVREKDDISLQPEAVIDPREASTYRLLFSWQGEQAEQGPRRTFAARVIFKRQLSFYGAVAMACSMVAVAFFVLKMLWVLALMTRHWFAHRPRRKRPLLISSEEGKGSEASVV